MQALWSSFPEDADYPYVRTCRTDCWMRDTSLVLFFFGGGGARPSRGLTLARFESAGHMSRHDLRHQLYEPARLTVTNYMSRPDLPSPTTWAGTTYRHQLYEPARLTVTNYMSRHDLRHQLYEPARLTSPTNYMSRHDLRHQLL